MFGSRSVQGFVGSERKERKCILVCLRPESLNDSSPTRQLTDTHFEGV